MSDGCSWLTCISSLHVDCVKMMTDYVDCVWCLVSRNSRHRMNTRRIGRFRITSGLSLSTKTRISKNITTLRKLRDHVRWRVAVLIKAPTAHLCLDADD